MHRAQCLSVIYNSMATTCDLVRRGVDAAISGGCSLAHAQPDCAITDAASKRDLFIQTKYTPSRLLTRRAREIRARELDILRNDIADDAAQIRQTHGADAPTDIAWNDFTRCLWNPDGQPGGPHGNTYFERNDLASIGYQPRPILGGAVLQGQFPRLTNAVPIWMDRFVNPDLAILVLIVALVCAALIACRRSIQNKITGTPARHTALT